MDITAHTTHNGITERLFTLGQLPGVVWTPAKTDGPRPLVLLGHGGGQHKKTPELLEIAHRLVTRHGLAAAALDVPGHGDRPTHPDYDRIATANHQRITHGADPAPLIAAFQAMVADTTVPEWRTALDALHQLLGPAPVGYFGVSLGAGLGLPFVAAEPRVRAAVLGLTGSPGLAEAAAGIDIPVAYLIQWHDERVPRAHALAVFDALRSPEKTLHANPGRHSELPPYERDSAIDFLARHLN